MRKIQVLHPHIANQIAAGEVVERPASVVKELVENALDAGAGSITVEIVNGGLSSIRVCDNGRGIPAGECVLAFERHATSKIHDQEDLTHIDTLGFRGEALASIAAVAQVDLKSRFMDAPTGVRVRMEGGQRKLVKPAACTQGTAITVENLFYNVPARRKFLKSPQSEASYIGDYMSRMVLSRPDVSFRYISQEKTVYHSQGDASLANAIYCVYGGELLAHLSEVNHDEGYLHLSGFIGGPEAARPNRTQQSFFLNGRYIRSSQISHALTAAYDTLLMGKRYPFAVLNIGIASREVDVNVHPTKLEVRFAQEGRVMGAITRACEKALAKSRHIPSMTASSMHAKSISDGRAEGLSDDHGQSLSDGRAECLLDDHGQSLSEDHGQSLLRDQSEMHPQGPPARLKSANTRSDMPSAAPVYKEGGAEEPSVCTQAGQDAPGGNSATALRFDAIPETSRLSIKLNESEYPIPQYKVDAPLRIEAGEAPVAQERARQQDFGQTPMAIIGQAFDSYWIVQQGEALYLIDQHAAHERILYERLVSEADVLASQTLLAPELLRLSALESGLLLAHADELAALGFDIAPFDAVTVRVDAIPAVLTGGNTGDMLRDALELIRKQGKASTKQLRREAIIQAACKHAVKAGDALAAAELQWLIDYFITGETPLRCPHGRPIVVKLDKREIEKMFKRIV